MKDQAQPLSGLYMVATPLGNLEDFTFRAVRILTEVDWIAAEDTRVSKTLLNAHGITTPLVSLHEHSGPSKIDDLIARLKNGEKGAYISDAGTPGICDPGAELVKRAFAENISVSPVPGASAPVALLSASGFSSSAFVFHGFFPREKKERVEWVTRVRTEAGLHVLFESPHRAKELLKILAENFPESLLVVGRELTKHFETITRDSARNVWELLEKEEARGEYVIALEVAALERDEEQSDQATETFLEELAKLGATQKILVAVAVSRGMAKNKAYDLALKVKK